MSKGLSRAERLREMERLYLEHGWTDIEMAERLGVDRTTVYKDRDLLSSECPIEPDDDGRYKINRTRYLSHIRVNAYEALALYLPARRAARQTLVAQPHIAKGLEKLAVALKRPMTERLVKAANIILAQAALPERVAIMETVTRGWIEQRKIRLAYRGLRARQTGHHIVKPYLIEPSLWSDGSYVIGHSDYFDDIAVFKIERIESAELKLETFEIPEDFDEQRMLRYAWGIWSSEEEPVTVRLKFSGHEAITRMKETIWHPLQAKPLDQPDGDCLWEAPIAEWQEMLPWVRGWGADVEVIAPEELREKLMREAQKMAELYQVMEMKKQLIAHIREKDKARQSLIEHLTVVSKLAGQFASKIGLKEAGEILGLLHDFGKASEQFQNYLLSGAGEKNPDADGYIDPEAMRGKIDHSTAGAQVLYENLWSKGQKEKIAAQVLTLCVASHHSGLIDCLAPDGENNFKRRMEKTDKDTHKSEALSNLQGIETAFKDLLSKNVVDQIVTKLQSLKEESNESQTNLNFKAGLLVRFLLSCLIDADRLDTADFESPGNVRIRNYGQYHPWEILIERLEDRLKAFEKKNEVDELRAQVSQACFEFAVKPKGIYQLTVPTGGGKTLASLRFALNHAREHSMERVFYVIPYTLHH